MSGLLRVLFAVLLTALVVPSGAIAEFGLEDFDVTFTNENGSMATQAGSHPFAMTTTESFNTTVDPVFGEVPDESIKDLVLTQIPGLVGDPTAVPRCSTLDFLAKEDVVINGKAAVGRYNACPDSSAVGHVLVSLESPAPFTAAAVYNLVPPPGVAAKLGFWALSVPVTVEIRVSPDPPYNIVAAATNVAQPVQFFGSELTLWGDPASTAHDALRGHCVFAGNTTEIKSNGNCPASISAQPFLTVPRTCEGPLATTYEADSWVHPGVFVKGSVLTHDNATPPNPLGFTGCGKLGFNPSITAKPTTKAAQSPSGLDFSLDVNDEGITNPTGLAQSDIRKAVVTMPEGLTINPSIAEGLEVCSETELARETASSAPGAGCPEASKIGTVEVETPLLDEQVNGSLYVAKPYENPFGSLVAMYLVIKNPTLGIVVRQPLKVEPDPVTGRLTTVAEDLPQLPYSHFRLHFREGARSPLASPPACGGYEAQATLYPSSGGAPVTTSSAFEIISGPASGPCPAGGLPPFRPGLIAGTLNNAAGHYSPFNLRLFRSDSEQEITHFSIKLPPGLIGKLAGIPFCPDAAIAAAKARTGPHGGAEELASPSCPAASEIGRTLVGAGVGSALAYAPGKIYLAGPYHGSQISLVAITAGVVGPFDIGTVVVREAFKIDRETAEVFIDATGSDPIPHIIKGIPTHLRDIRTYTDRPQFVLNPTGCQRTSTATTILGSGLDFGSGADDRPVTVSTPFQAADCAALAFKPRLSMRLRGATRRGGHPRFSATLRMAGSGESNIRYAQVTLPRSEFLENAHIKTICTRVQFRAEQCPPGSIYGHARALTPLLDEPLEGPVFLRSSEHQLPDLVAELRNGQIVIDLIGRIDSLRGRIRNTFEAAPDAPVNSFTLTMAGGKKGLLVNSTNLCRGPHRAIADFRAHNGKQLRLRPALRADCAKGNGKGKRRKAG
jgi:hypothetical protein